MFHAEGKSRLMYRGNEDSGKEDSSNEDSSNKNSGNETRDNEDSVDCGG